MKHILPYFAIVVVLLYALYNAQTKQKTHTKQQHTTYIQPQVTTPVTDTYSYIVQVINEGSSRLHFKPQEVMEGGFASKEDAPKIACFVMELRGERCPTPKLAQEGELYFSSNCAGCHGNDAKGIHGTYPDLTRKTLLGLEK